MSRGPCSTPLITPWQVLRKPLLPWGSLNGFSWALVLLYQICTLFPSPGSSCKKVGHLDGAEGGS